MREPTMVGRAELQPYDSYYGRPILKPPPWEARDIAGYLFLGGLAGASALLAEGAALTGRPGLARAARAGAVGGAGLGTVALIHDLGRPERFVNMLRVFKPTSPMSVGSFVLAPFTGLSVVAALSSATGRLPRIGRAAGVGAAALGAPLATYTAALLSDTAVPAWHDGHRHMPYTFAGSAASAAGGWGMLLAPRAENAPARAMALGGTALEAVTVELMKKRIGMTAEPYSRGRGGTLLQGARVANGTAVALSLVGGRSRVAAALAGTAYLMGSVLTRFGIFAAGIDSAKDPAYTVSPQRDRQRSTDPIGAPAAG
ncbi:MAG TPA: NrfD/PsrC family molybdoenzyme membrane anchor subunit [Nocardioidaceae bacterium]|nr:NrfD/PsrC family molybdoenzyme membrane anchor subunit [Nocardioidaceae bacterium]